MKARIFTTGVLVGSLALTSCGSLQDDAFAHQMKSGNARMAVATMQPGQARLQIQEPDGRWYYPIQYAVVRGDTEATFGLIRAGSPTVFDGRSLAYNAARVNQPRLARQLAGAGYGREAEVDEALALNRREQSRQRRNDAVAAASMVALFWWMASGNSGSSHSGYEEDHMRNHIGVDQAERDSKGLPYQY